MVIWTDNAISNITEFIDEANEGTEQVAKKYMQKLIYYAEILDDMKKMGKKMPYIISNYEVRQVIYKKHRIIYTIDKDSVVILAVIHTRLDINKALKRLNRGEK